MLFTEFGSKKNPPILLMLETIECPVVKITTEILRKYLVEYQSINNCGKVTIDNIRRILSTFFS